MDVKETILTHHVQSIIYNLKLFRHNFECRNWFHIVDYIVKNGSIDKKELKDFPEADKFGGLFQLFNNKRDVLTNIVKIIDKVNDRLDLVQ